MIYWITNLMVIGLALLFFYSKWIRYFSPSLFWVAFFVKIVAGLACGWIFLSQYSGADTFAYFNKAQSLINQPFKSYLNELFSSSSYEITSQPRVLFFTKVLSPFVYLSGGSYWITSIYLSTISFMASWWTVVKLSKIFPKDRSVINPSFLFIPSIVFWSSGILKDAIVSSALLVLVGITLTKHKKLKTTLGEMLLALFSLFILYKLKHYILIIFILFAGTLFFLDLIKSSKVKVKVAAIGILLVVMVSTQFIHPYLNLKRLPLTLYENNLAILQKSRTENQLDIRIESPDWFSVLKEIPLAIKTGLFRPSVFDPTISLGWLHKIENLILTFLTMASVLIFLKEKTKIDALVAITSIFSILILATLLALSTPNFGTLVRYKTVFMPFFFFLVSILP